MIRRGKRVMIFGVFDLLHPGHLYALYHARLAAAPPGDTSGELVVVVARDSAVRRLKGISPEWSERRRAAAVRATGIANKVILGDARQGSYNVIEKHQPDVICLGYDQKKLKRDLLARIRSGRLPRTITRTLKPYKPVLYHTSLQRKRKKQ